MTRTIAGNLVRSAPEAAGYGALQHIEANPQTSGADLIKGVLKNVAVTGGITAAGGLAGAGVRRVRGAGGVGEAVAPAPEGHVPEAFRNLPGSDASGNTLYTYTYRPWEGNIMETGPQQGRLWATKHPPGPWAYATDPANTALRAWRTGRSEPFVDFSPITGAVRDQFTKPLAIGPLRGWKRLAGQNYTNQPGNMNLKTGEILQPTPHQTKRLRRDDQASHAFDGGADAFLAGLGGLLYYGQKPVNLPPLPPNEQTRHTQPAASLPATGR